jgi:hypothetical protein
MIGIDTWNVRTMRIRALGGTTDTGLVGAARSRRRISKRETTFL